MSAWSRRRRYKDLVRRQLDLFEADNADRISECRRLLADAMSSADDESSRELYAKHDDLAEDIDDGLDDMVMAFGATIDQEIDRTAYEEAFRRQARRRLGDVSPSTRRRPRRLDDSE